MGWDVARGGRGHQQPCGHRAICNRIDRAYIKQKRRHQARQCRGSDKANRNANGREQHAMLNDHGPECKGLGAKSDTNALSRASAATRNRK